MAKKYAVALDTSPSEQISGVLHNVKTLGIVVGLKSPSSFEEVGLDFPEMNQRMALRKWSLSSAQYKMNFVRHMRRVVATGNIVCGFSHSNEANILGVGGLLFQKSFGRFPEPSSWNKKGKPRIVMGGYFQDDREVPRYEVLAFDLCTIGWIASELISLLHMIDDISGENCKLDVIVDRLPNEQGGEKYLLSTMLRTLLSRESDSRIDLVGVPDPAVVAQRDLFVDNVAGLAHLCLKSPDSRVAEEVNNNDFNLFGISRDEDYHFLKVSDDWHLNRLR
jgi:hypothetical protein